MYIYIYILVVQVVTTWIGWQEQLALQLHIALASKTQTRLSSWQETGPRTWWRAISSWSIFKFKETTFDWAVSFLCFLFIVASFFVFIYVDRVNEESNPCPVASFCLSVKALMGSLHQSGFQQQCKAQWRHSDGTVFGGFNMVQRFQALATLAALCHLAPPDLRVLVPSNWTMAERHGA